MPDTDIVLTIDLNTTDAEKTAKQLHKEVESIFEARNGQQSASLTSLELQLKKNVKAIQEVQQEMGKIGEQKIPTAEYQKLQEELQQITQKYEKLEEKRGKFGADRAEREALEKEFNAKADEAQMAYDRYRQLQKELQQQPDNWKIKSDFETARVEMSALNAEVERLQQQLDQPKFTALDEMDEKSLKLGEDIENLELKMKELETSGKAFLTVSPEETEEYQKLVKQRDILLDKLKQELIKHEEIARKEEERAAKSPTSQMGSELRGFNYEMTSLTSTLRGITRLIPGVNSTAIMGISMITRGLTRLVHITKDQLVAALNTVKETIAKLFAMIAAHPIIALITAIIAALAVLGMQLKKLYDKTKEQIENIIDLSKRGIKTIIELLKNTLTTLTKDFVLIGTSIPRLLIKGFALLTTKLKSLKNTIQENLNVMAQWNQGQNTLNYSMREISASFQYIKSALASMVAPLVNSLAPVISSIADRLSEMVTNIGMLIAKMSGAKSFQRVVRHQQEYNKALYETNKQLSSLDDLNIINLQNQGIDFEEVDLENAELTDWMVNLSSMSKDAISALTSLLDEVPWDNIQKRIAEISTSFADLLNDISDLDWGETLGKAFGEGLNTLNIAVNNFLDEFDGKKFGQQIGDALETMITTVDFKGLGEIFSSSVNKLSDIVIGFTDTIKGEDLASALTDFLQTALGGIDWVKVQAAIDGLVEDLVGFLNGVMTEDNLNTVATTLSNVLTTLFNGLWKFVKEVDWEEWGYRIGGAMETMVRTTDWKMGGMAIGKLASGLLDTLIAAVKRIKWTGPGSVGQALIDLLAGIPWADLGKKAKEIGEEVRKGLDDVWEEMKKSGELDDIIGFIADVLQEQRKWEKFFTKKVREIIWKAFWKSLLGDWTEFFEGLSEKMEELPEKFKSYFSPVKGTGTNGKVSGSDVNKDLQSKVAQFWNNSILGKLLPIKGYATGQVIPPSMSEHLAILGDNKHETEVVSPLSTMQEALYNALQQVGFNSGAQEIVLNLDGREFMRAMVKHNNDYKKQHGGQSAFI